MQRGEPRARRDDEHETDHAPHRLPTLGQLLAAEQEHAGNEHENREQECRGAEQQESDVGEPSARGAHAVLDGAVAAGDRERGIRLVVAQQREQEDQAQSGQYPERGLAQRFVDARHEEGLECGAGLGFIQVARQLVDLMR